MESIDNWVINSIFLSFKSKQTNKNPSSITSNQMFH